MTNMFFSLRQKLEQKLDGVRTKLNWNLLNNKVTIVSRTSIADLMFTIIIKRVEISQLFFVLFATENTSSSYTELILLIMLREIN